MFCRVEIIDGQINIVLSAENEFEKTIIDNACDSVDYSHDVKFKREDVPYVRNDYKNQRIEITFNKERERIK